jgi:hypothetical protein
VPLPQAAQKKTGRSPAAVEYGLNVYVLPETGKAAGNKAKVVLANVFANKVSSCHCAEAELDWSGKLSALHNLHHIIRSISTHNHSFYMHLIVHLS